MSKPPFLALPAGAAAVRLDTDRGAFAALDAGTGRSGTALLIPGFTGSKEDFLALLPPLTEAGYRVVAVDGRGQYETPGADDDEAAYAQDALARDLLAQAAALSDGGPLHLLGHSLGGHISRAAVLLDPSPFASLTLMSSGPAAVAQGQQERLKLLTDALRTMPMEDVWQAIRALDPPEAADERTPDDVSAFLHRRWLGTRRAQLLATARQLATAPDRTDELTPVPLPKHVLSGAVDYAWPVHLLDEMAQRLGARRTVIAGAEHSPNAEQPAETAAALADFWTESAAS
ncbi:alpha/beta fold hydrolase [Streptomyces sp. A7024]|uniref:Alpha/beta fold hydrolase n=1 Tax=Streptomyces coryli TaxID=1128680 RepID=A0A6G4U8J6_9ACTN|nr:alpha/beta fold hydrolase [Streptomyces coryli]NGN67501.1 alpha/beta fold hydrolase [Streptomyces coryli]